MTMTAQRKPRGALLQVALDFLELSRALTVAEAAAAGGADILEAGTPLIKSEGLDAVRELRARFPHMRIVADMKTMDTGRIEMEAAAKAGANAAVVMGAASGATIRECVEAGRNYGVAVGVDLLGVADPVGLARDCEEWGADHLHVHTPIDEQMRGADPFDRLRQLREAVSLPLAAAGGINSETAADAVAAGADIVIVGGAISKSADPRQATEDIKRAITTGEKIPTTLYRRVGLEQVREILLQVSTANASDGGHRLPPLAGIRPVMPGLKLVGPAVTVRTYPGDWAKPVEAIDQAAPGDVIAIDAGGVPPAVWGELATHSAAGKDLAGVVIDGAIRDTAEIRELRFPAFARHITPQALEPKGLGEIGVPVRISGQLVEPGDWLLGDDDGVVLLPRNRVVELTNRAMDCLERENRIRQEILEGKTTLAQVMELLRWEKPK
jgi:3-hexulose-6-phosphate synthase/6-phospho-3-hexuloisomerase